MTDSVAPSAAPGESLTPPGAASHPALRPSKGRVLLCLLDDQALLEVSEVDAGAVGEVALQQRPDAGGCGGWCAEGAGALEFVETLDGGEARSSVERISVCMAVSTTPGATAITRQPPACSIPTVRTHCSTAAFPAVYDDHPAYGVLAAPEDSMIRCRSHVRCAAARRNALPRICGAAELSRTARLYAWRSTASAGPIGVIVPALWMNTTRSPSYALSSSSKWSSTRDQPAGSERSTSTCSAVPPPLRDRSITRASRNGTAAASAAPIPADAPEIQTCDGGLAVTGARRGRRRGRGRSPPARRW